MSFKTFLMACCLLLAIAVTVESANQAYLVDYYGMNAAGAQKMKNKVNELLLGNPSNDRLTSLMNEYLQKEEKNTSFLVAIQDCKEYCFAGSMPKMYSVFDIDRNRTRLMITGRYKC